MPEIKPYKDQVYEVLKGQHNSSELFVDPEFPTTQESLYPSGKSFMRSGESVYEIIWRRPKDLCEDPKFEVDGFKCGDLDQGELGNCWFIAAANALVLQPDLHGRTVPPYQSFDDGNYAGIFHFRFWIYGQWHDVVIDDQLPCYPHSGLIFCQNTDEKNEMWAPLLEKAYAKLCGSYEAIDGGRTERALIDMTGGIGEVISFAERRAQVSNWKEDITQVIWQAYKHKSLLGCSISSPQFGGEEKLANGLVRGHAYAITRVADVRTDTGQLILIQCQNPWGNQIEWNGDFSDNSPAWNQISNEEKEKLSLGQRNDGKFWMSADDFMRNFHEIQICHQELATFQKHSYDSGDDKLTWKETMFHGAWILGLNAGGCGNDRAENFWKNPQYLVTVSLADDTNRDELCTMIIFMMLKIPHDRRLRRDEDRITYHFEVYKVLDENHAQEHLEQGNFKFRPDQLKLIKDTGTYVNALGVSLRIEAEPGSYVIITSTFKAHTEAKFLLRVFTEGSIKGEEVVETEDGDQNEDSQSNGSHSDLDSRTSFCVEEHINYDDSIDDRQINGTNPDCSVM